ncbi:MAG: TlpA disulfide reductase family protein [Planctomycetaceae bacterium]
MRRRTCFWIAPALAAALLGCDADSPPETAAAAPIELQEVTPEELNKLVAENPGKVVLFDFWATWCIPCLKQYPHTVELSEKYADDLVVYSVSMDMNDDETLSLVKEKLGEWPAGNVRTLINAQEPLEDAFTAYEITDGALPHYKVFGRDGKVAATLGGIENVPTPETVDAAVEQALGVK